MISIHSLSELERLKLQETAYQELMARHFLSEFKPDRVPSVISLKTFGIPLEEVLVNELTQKRQKLRAAMQMEESTGLNTVGIFTLEYSHERVREFCEEFDQGLGVVLENTQNMHDVAALLKELFSDMKDSLLPDNLYMSFLLTATLKPQDQLSALQLLVYLMSPCHSDTLECLLKALHKITENCEDSIGIYGQLVSGKCMTSTNLALVFGSAVLRKGKFDKRESRKTRLGIDHHAASVNVVCTMIDNWDILFQVPPHIQRQVAKHVWKSSTEALYFIRCRNLRKIQSAHIKMEEDALLSDPMENSDEARAAVLVQSKPFDEGQFPAGDQTLAESQALGEGQTLFEGQVLAEDEPLEEDESSEEDVTINEDLIFEYLNEGVVFGEVQGLEIPNDFEIQGPILEDILELDEKDDESEDDDDDGTVNFDDLPPLEDILDPDDEIPELIEIPEFEEIPYFDMVPDPEEVPDVQDIPNPGEIPNHHLEEGPNFEDYQNLVLTEVSYFDVIPNNEQTSDVDEISDNEETPDTDIPEHEDASDNDGNSDSEKDPNLEEVLALDEIPNNKASAAEEISDHEETPEVNGILDSDEDLDFEEVPALHVVPSLEEAPDGHEILNHEASPKVDELSDSEEDLNIEEVPALDRVSTDEETSDTEEIPGHGDTPEVNGIAGSEEESNPEDAPALHVVTSPEDASDFDDIQDEDESSHISGVLNHGGASDSEEISGYEEASDASGIQNSKENPNLEQNTVLSVVPEPEDTHIHCKMSSSQKDRANTFREDQLNNVISEHEDISIFSKIPDPQPDPAVSLEEIMNVEAVPMPDYLDSKEIHNPKAIQFHKEDSDITFSVGITLLKNKSQQGQVMNYKLFPESLKIDSCFFPSMKCCSSEEPAVPPGTAHSHYNEEGTSNPHILEQDHPLLRVPREKEAKTGIGYFFP